MSLREFQEGEKQSSTGYAKIRACCALAVEHSLDWVWIDTCCIDKSSSAELTEAINSMFNWYSNATMCFAYISDVQWDIHTDLAVAHASFRASLWFTRGWTLQELLAPSIVIFFDRNWIRIGDKSTLMPEIPAATRIAKEYMFDPMEASVATKMSWVARRQTSRSEDIAYCMLGLFDVNMPLLYGEGNKVFLRLQEEIISSSDDESIFAWISDSPRAGIIATSPTSFEKCHDIRTRPFGTINRMPYTLTNKGLQVYIPNKPGTKHNVPRDPRYGYSEKTPMFFQINCFRGGDLKPLAIQICPYAQNKWYRVNCEKLERQNRVFLNIDHLDDQKLYPIFVKLYNKTTPSGWEF